MERCPGGSAAGAGYTFTVTGRTFQMSSQYSAIAQSDENFPLRAVFRIDIRLQTGCPATPRSPGEHDVAMRREVSTVEAVSYTHLTLPTNREV